MAVFIIIGIWIIMFNSADKAHITDNTEEYKKENGAITYKIQNTLAFHSKNRRSLGYMKIINAKIG